MSLEEPEMTAVSRPIEEDPLAQQLDIIAAYREYLEGLDDKQLKFEVTLMARKAQQVGKSLGKDYGKLMKEVMAALHKRLVFQAPVTVKTLSKAGITTAREQSPR